MEYLIATLIQCSEPRLSFRSFLDKMSYGPYPGRTGEQIGAVHERAAEAAGLYGVYSVRYTVKCEAK